METSTTAISYGETLMKWGTVLANVHAPDMDFASNLDCVTKLDQFLLESKVHLETDPAALWFKMSGLLATFMATPHVARNSKVAGAYLVLQSFFLTLFVVQEPLIPGRNNRLSIFVFDIDAFRFAPGPFQPEQVLRVLSKDFSISKVEIEEAFLHTKVISIKRQIELDNEAFEDLNPFTVTATSKALKPGRKNAKPLHLYTLSNNGREVTAQHVAPAIFSQDFQSMSDKLPKISTKVARLAATYCQSSTGRDLDQNRFFWFMDGVVNGVQDRLGVSSTVLFDNKLPRRMLVLLRNVNVGKNVNYHKPYVYVTYEPDTSSLPVLPVAVQTLSREAHFLTMFLRMSNSFPPTVASLKMSGKEQSVFDGKQNVEELMVQVSLLRHDVRRTAKELGQILENMLHFHGAQNTKYAVLGHFSAHRTNDVYVTDKSPNEATFVIKVNAFTCLIVSFMDTTQDSVPIPEKTSLHSLDIWKVAGIFGIIIGPRGQRDVFRTQLSGFGTVDLSTSVTMPQNDGCQLGM